MLEALREVYSELKSLRKEINVVQSQRINKIDLRKRAESLGSLWFSEISHKLKAFNISPELIEAYSINFSRLIKISAPNNLKKSYLDTLGSLTSTFRDDFIIPIQKPPIINESLLSELLKSLEDPNENEYIREAVNCANHKYYRAAVILGWCAAIDRIHRVIEKLGFDKYNAKSVSMVNDTKGRFKRFNSAQNVHSISELREVFDNIILWIIEGMMLIDGNQHTRLRGCFDMRCQCAHPGDAPITEYNLLSYFSDLNEIIFKNPKFKVN